MKKWYFKVDSIDTPCIIEAESFENAYAQLCVKPEFKGEWKLIKFEDVPSTISQNVNDLHAQSIDLWAKLPSLKEIDIAKEILNRYFTTMKEAVEFDSAHPEIIDMNPMAHDADLSQLTHLENCVDELNHVVYS